MKELKRSSLIIHRKYVLTYRKAELAGFFFFFFFFYISGVFFMNIMTHMTAGEGVGYFFNSSLPLPPASQTRRH